MPYQVKEDVQLDVPLASDGVSVLLDACGTCGAFVADTVKHRYWHRGGGTPEPADAETEPKNRIEFHLGLDVSAGQGERRRAARTLRQLAEGLAPSGAEQDL